MSLAVYTVNTLTFGRVDFDYYLARDAINSYEIRRSTFPAGLWTAKFVPPYPDPPETLGSSYELRVAMASADCKYVRLQLLTLSDPTFQIYQTSDTPAQNAQNVYVYDGVIIDAGGNTRGWTYHI